MSLVGKIVNVIKGEEDYLAYVHDKILINNDFGVSVTAYIIEPVSDNGAGYYIDMHVLQIIKPALIEGTTNLKAKQHEAKN